MRKLFACVVTFAAILGLLVFLGNNPSMPQPWKPEPVPKPVPPTPPVPPQEITIDQALAMIKRENVVNNMTYLTSDKLEGRMSGMNGNRLAAEHIEKEFKSFGLQTQQQSFPVQKMNEFKEKSTGSSANVVAILPGTNLKYRTILVGAHMDHIGYGPKMSQAPGRREIHPGADDNASGTTALVEIARALAAVKKNRHTLIFVAFSGEEMGLIGSKHYVNNPPYPLPVFMLNMDMVGRYNGSTLDCGGAANSPQVRDAINRIKSQYTFTPKITSGSGGGSDHIPFYQKSIPTTFLHTGMHRDYHTPEDKASKINMDGLVMVAKFAAHLVWEMDKLGERPAFIGSVADVPDFRDHDFSK